MPEIEPQLEKAAKDTFHMQPVTAAAFRADAPCHVIGMLPGELITEDCGTAAGIDVQKDILKIAVIERHKGSGRIGIGYLHGYGLRRGAVAASVAHDAHNLIVIGTNEADMAAAANRVLADHGGIARRGARPDPCSRTAGNCGPDEYRTAGYGRYTAGRSKGAGLPARRAPRH